MTTPTPKETALDILRGDLSVSASPAIQHLPGVREHTDKLLAAIAWLEGLQADSDERCEKGA